MIGSITNGHDHLHETRPPRVRVELREIGFVGRALGWKWIERNDEYAVLLVPWWIPMTIRKRALGYVAQDWAVRYETPLRILVGPRLVRFDW